MSHISTVISFLKSWGLPVVRTLRIRILFVDRNSIISTDPNSCWPIVTVNHDLLISTITIDVEKHTILIIIHTNLIHFEIIIVCVYS